VATLRANKTTVNAISRYVALQITVSTISIMQVGNNG
jgi:hypothetical protein